MQSPKWDTAHGEAPMNVGVFVTFVKPKSMSQARLQTAIFSGLGKVGGGRYRFIVFSLDPSPIALDGGFLHQPVARYGKWEEIGRRLRANIAGMAWRLWQFTGASGGRTWDRLARLSKFEPKHFQQMRDLDIRLLWNMNQHELKVPVPFMRTIWEANHRIHSMFPEYSYARYGYDGVDGGMAESLARASYVLTGTMEGKRQLIEMFGVHAGKVRVIPLPAPVLNAANAKSDAVSSGQYILYPSRFWPHKNHVVILEALKILRQEHAIELRCVFTGADQGNLAYVLGYAERLGVRDLIDYRGEVTEEDLALLYKSAFALVYASAVGPDNLPPLEAMALSCPVIAADVPGAREQYDDAALLFNATDERAMAGLLLMLLRDDSIRPQQIARGKARIANLSADNYATAVIRILDEFSAVARAWERCDSVFV
jgi:glycosyltransferase involved in cell wall biosynthesis